MHTVHTPPDIAPPVAPSYSHGIEVAPGARWLTIAGQVGIGPDGELAQGVGPQADRTWRNIVAILESAGMGLEDLVKVNTFVTNANDIPVLRKIRADYQVEGYRPASTFLVVAGLASPDYLVEIEAIAAKA